MKKKILFVIRGISFIIIIVVLFIIFKDKPVTTKINLTKNNEVIYGSIVNPRDFVLEIIDGKIINGESILIDEFPSQTITLNYLDSNDNKQEKKIELTVKDIDKPVILNARNITVYTGNEVDFMKGLMVGDNQSRKPNIIIDGDYDLNQVGIYNLKYVITDDSKNETIQHFKLKVINKPETSDSSNNISSTTSNTTPKNYLFDDFKKDYKNKDTLVGIDVSKWQGEINWDAVQKSGVEFAMIRIGYQTGIAKELKTDPYFVRNIVEANRVGIPIGLYFYSYASNNDEAKKQAEWIINKIKDYKVSLPIAFDWENWNSFSNFEINFLDLNQIANTFMNVIENNGYKSILYSSKSYLDNVWNTYENVWLAHYTNKSSYEDECLMWQRSSVGKVDGINADVDLNVLYK